MRRAAKVDANQREIVESLRQLPHVSVYVTSAIGMGFPDIVVGYKGVNYLIELKDGKKIASAKKLTPLEKEFFASWRGTVYVCECVEDILKIIYAK